MYECCKKALEPVTYKELVCLFVFSERGTEPVKRFLQIALFKENIKYVTSSKMRMKLATSRSVPVNEKLG